jgi:hypothetical protein
LQFGPLPEKPALFQESSLVMNAKCWMFPGQTGKIDFQRPTLSLRSEGWDVLEKFLGS